MAQKVIKSGENFTISFNWETKTTQDSERIGAMYCFKNCDVNKN